MASMRHMPYLIRNMMSVGSWHKTHLKRLKLLFHPLKPPFPIKKGASKLKKHPYFEHIFQYISHLAWFDPLLHNRSDSLGVNHSA